MRMLSRALRLWRDRARDERGAALLLMLFIVPALAIAGAAFLSMATGESERTRAQGQWPQALYYAEGGVARANWALVNTSRLEKVSVSMPAGVSACTASQSGTTSGALNWSGANVTITATGSAGGYARQVQRQVSVTGSSVNLKNVITSPGVIDLKKSCTVNGPVVTGDASTDYSEWLGTHTVTIATVQMLDVSSAITTILSSYVETTVTSAQIDVTSVASPYAFNGSAGTAVYYTNDPGLWVSNSGGGNKCISVQGECIWCIRNGASFGKEFTFTPIGLNPKLLILVSKESGVDGLDVQKAMDAVGLPVVIVTDGEIDIRKASTFDNIAMYGTEVDSDKDQAWTYTPAIMDPIIDSYEARSLLPRVLSGGSGTTTYVSGSWASF